MCVCVKRGRGCLREAEQVWEDNVFSVESGLVGCTGQYILFFHSAYLNSGVFFYIHSSSLFHLATFQMLNIHLWSMGSALNT